MGFFDQMKQLKELQDKMEEAKKRLEAIEVDAANDYVKVTVTGNRKVKNIELFKLDDKLTLEAKIQSALNEAMAKADNVMQSEMMGAMPKIPGLG
ncbi:MAG TPA: YbaB/EbfC family nucleoid-associated protein [Chitinophagales bacterium]|nr:YbaB/EbfC family nucleoid-associated protein [Chitinophagales bacterium]